MKRLAILVTFALAACGGETPVDANGDGIADKTTPSVPTSVTEVAPSSPKGHITGRVQMTTGAPIAGANVTVTGVTAVNTTTDANGLFSVDGLTAGSTVGVFVNATGYAPGWTTATVPAATGNFPLNGGEDFAGTLTLVPTTGTITFYLVGYDGKGVDKAGAVLDVTPAFGLNKGRGAGTSYQGDISVSATSTAGEITFTGVPRVEDAAWMATAGVTVNYHLYVAPVRDDSGNLLYGGKVWTITAKALLESPWERTLVLPPPSETSALSIIATNVANLMSTGPTAARDNLINKTGPIYVVFNQPIAKDVFAEIRDDKDKEKDSTVIPINTPVLNELGTQLQITVKSTSPGPLIEGQKYYLTLQVMPLHNPAAAPKRYTVPFFCGDPGAPKQIAQTTVNIINGSGFNWDPNPIPGPAYNAQPMEIVFDKYIGVLGSTAHIPIYFQDDLDLDNSGIVGDRAGERASSEPICVPASETVPGWLPGAAASSYARKFVIAPGTVLLGKSFAASGLFVTVAFGEAAKCPGGALETVWGDPLNTTLGNLSVTAVPPPPP